MKIKYVKGNLLDAPEKYILHGCNAQGKMASGVAKLIREKWPESYLAYKASEQTLGYLRLGGVSYAETKDDKIIINIISQEFYGRDPNRRYVDYDATEDALERINWWIPTGSSVAMPKIGAGLGGGDWKIIEGIIAYWSRNFQAVVYEL